MQKRRTNLIEFIVLGTALFICAMIFDGDALDNQPIVQAMIPEIIPQEPVTMLFAGDVMLGRHVGVLIKRHGTSYPFERILPSIKTISPDFFIANLEGPITELEAIDTRVSPEQPYPMRFFFDPSVVEALTKIGFSHLSVANNHIFDQGRAGANDTFTNLTNAGIEAIGYRDGTTLGSIATTTLRGHDIAFIALDTTTTPHDLDDIEEELAPLGEDIFITSFLHWGNEYETVHSDEQEEFAHALIDRGVDLIIGAHPHVVQDIEEYNGARIYYSLGNFIFDQYWNESVRDGLMVLVTLDGDDTSFTDISITSDHSKSQPYIESIIAGE